MSQTLTLVFSTAGTALFGWLLYDGFRRGTMQYDYFSLHLHGHRKDQPVRFWLTAMVIVLCLLMSVTVMTLALML